MPRRNLRVPPASARSGPCTVAAVVGSAR